MARIRISVRGAVQGVGFRPFVYRVARELGLAGWVGNDPDGVIIEIEGEPERLEQFVGRLTTDAPDPARVEEVARAAMEPTGAQSFEIRTSRGAGAPSVQVLPDLATCEDCLEEIADPSDRRHGYPFTNCTRCGPRLTVIRSLPYDRARTTMAAFEMCPDCRREYEDPADRRFHAQPNACPACGPRVSLWDREGVVLARGDEAMGLAVDELRQGRILAVKGLGGFHLMVDAADEEAVIRLRERKTRRAKPLALMVPNVAAAHELCELDGAELEVLTSVEAPIVLARRRPGAPVSGAIAPDNLRLGIMVPSNPLHHLLLEGFGTAVVATSGNLSEEPICIDESEALTRLSGIADMFLVHDRPIARHVDDGVVRLDAGAPRMLRRSRGHVPRPVRLGRKHPCLLAVGGHLKSTVALSVGDRVYVSQHVGDLETAEARAAFERVAVDFLEMWQAEPVAVIHDLHPDYASTRWAAERTEADAPAHPSLGVLRGLPTLGVQHHHAHLASCLAEAGWEGEALGVIWDGTGYGPDGTVWGGEFLLGSADGYRRVARLSPFRLLGADAAIREPRRSALALLYGLLGEAARDDPRVRAAFEPQELRPLLQMAATGLRSPMTSSMGRLFDGVAALLGLHPISQFEGQAAMALEHLVTDEAAGGYPFGVVESDGVMELDWRPIVDGVLGDLRSSVAPGTIASRFHGALVDAVVDITDRVAPPAVALSGGCFQNRLLLQRCADRLEAAGVRVLLHRWVPANDGGLSLGQIAVGGATFGD